ncbi:uncharacterized mitochondrial protein AtMg00810-like [Vicia villosa]|uniref:uncharacterized mitochondrial protein AtMg00810-like n=1 Tax=Vicia villosa TaxID=3911 RepID=UPI00273B6761|nr:uncharacterized mitochondrial protein AtMg00810-like [Vicia villosa]
MQTRAKSGFNQPRLEPRLLLAASEPKTTKQALAVPNWLAAMKAEYNALISNKPWTLAHLPTHRQAIGTYYHQDYTFYHITIRIILSITLTYRWSIQELNVNNAFLNGLLDGEVYMAQPQGFEQDNPNLVCRFNKASYGLKQAPMQWFERLQAAALVQLKFRPSKCDPSLFTYFEEGHTVYLLVYVDDIIITGSSTSLLKSIITKLNVAFSLKHLGVLDYFLGIQVTRIDPQSLLLTQSKYVKDLLLKTNMSDCAPVSTPMQSTCKLTKAGSPAFGDPYMYRSVVGALRYATLTRPDIAYAVNKVCQFMAHPLDTHWVEVKRILRYLKGTLTHGLQLTSLSSTSAPSVQLFCDADWASDPDDRRSPSGAVIYFGPNLVSWWSKKVDCCGSI